MENFGTQLKQLREARGWSQNQLAILAGLTRGQINSIEHRKSERPSADVVLKLAKAFNITAQQLIGHEVFNSRQETPEELLERLKFAQPVSIPVYRKFHFGNPSEEPLDYVYYARSKAVGKNIEAFLVTGDCLSPRIENGDIVIVDRDKVPEPGKLMICLIGDEVAVGKYTMEKGTAYLTNHDAKVKITNVKACAVIINVIKDV